jgi:iron complex outermembrane recepter protein
VDAPRFVTGRMAGAVLGLGLWLAPSAGPALAQAPAGATQQATVAVTGTVRTLAGAPVGGAVITVDADPQPAGRTDAQGRFSLSLAAGVHTLHASSPGHAPASLVIRAGPAPAPVDIVLNPLPRFAEDVTVAAVRADADAPMTTRNLSRHDIEALNAGQEMPFLLKDVPSLTQYSDSGSTSGYASVLLRGIPQSRMNVTLDGVPLNEAEDSTFYFANFGDFANAIGSLQVQRGVGTSTVGASSFVGSINFASVDFAETFRTDVRAGSGSFGTRHVSGDVHSGRLADGWKLYGQAAYQESDGFREHSGMKQQSLYLGASRDNDISFFKVFGFAGRERSQLAYIAPDEAALEANPRANPMSPDERDDFTQRFLTAQYHRAIGPAAEFSVQGYYNGADGWYRLLDAAEGLLQYGLSWHSAGATATYRAVRGPVDLTWGGHANGFGSHHSRDIVGGSREYANQGFKNEVNSFAKLGYATGRWHHYGDVQVRWARFRYQGDLDLGSVSWTFVNPKVGTRYDLGRGVSLYGSLGAAGREPGRSDMLQGEDNPTVVHDLRAVKPERVVNIETGVDFTRPGFTVRANAFFMEFRDEIAQTGELSETYLPLRRNVDRSFRRGLEVDLTWQPVRTLTVRHSATYSYNRIRNWTQFYDVYDAEGNWVDSTSRTHDHVVPLLTPAVVFNLSGGYTPASWLTIDAGGRYVGTSHLDNTGNAAFTSPGFFGLDAGASVSLARLLRVPARVDPRVRIQVTNALNNRHMYPSGYSYQYFILSEGGALQPDGTRYYYPLATRSAFVMLDLRF